MSSPLHAHASPSRIAHNYGLQSIVAAPVSPSASTAARQSNSPAAAPGLLLRDHAAPVSPSAQSRAQTIAAHLTAGSTSYAALGASYATPSGRASPNPSPVGSPVSYAHSPSPSPAPASAAGGKQSRPALLAPMWVAASGSSGSSAPSSPSASAASSSSSSSSAPLPYSTPVAVSAADPHLLIRRAHSSDYSKGHVTLLSQLTTVGSISASDYTARSRLLERHGELLHCLVIEDTSCSTIIASATLLVEPKFVHSCGWVGHIEDVVVSSLYRGKNLGHRILTALHDLARRAGCYKIVLDCAEANKPFYEKIGYQEKERHMRLDL